jgi:hypothetical protein
MPNADAMAKLIADLRKDLEANPRGPLPNKYFERPFCVMEDYGLGLDERNCLLTMDHNAVGDYLIHAGHVIEGEWVKRFEAGAGWDVTDGHGQPKLVKDYMRDPCRPNPPDSGPTILARSGWPGPRQEIRERAARGDTTRDVMYFEILGEGLYPEGTIILRSVTGNLAEIRRKAERVYVKSIHSTRLLSAEEKLDPSLRGTAWHFSYLNDGSKKEISDVPLPAYTISF